MKDSVKTAIAQKVKKEAFDCHRVLKTSSTRCEPQYVDFYIHCLHSFGCEITYNEQNRYLGFIVDDVEKISVDVCKVVESYVEPVRKPLNLELILVMSCIFMAITILLLIIYISVSGN